jgi:hypothetical protein
METPKPIVANPALAAGPKPPAPRPQVRPEPQQATRQLQVAAPLALEIVKATNGGFIVRVLVQGQLRATNVYSDDKDLVSNMPTLLSP